MESKLPMYKDIHCKERGDDTGLGGSTRAGTLVSSGNWP
jgi:hypothetical protein